MHSKNSVLIASKSGNLNILQFLEKQKGNYWHCVDKNGNTGLHIACKKGHPLDVIESLCRKIDANSRNYLGQTPFMLSCMFSQIQIVKWLVECNRSN